MKTTLSALVLLLASHVALANEALELEANSIAQAYIAKLKPALQNAMKSKGPVHAVRVCAEEAPEIAKSMSVNGWQVRRVSLKPRNPAASADSFETRILKEFDQMTSTETDKPLTYSERLPDEYRYLKGQVAGGICLTCHGQTINEDIRTVLQTLYPDDKAIGYSPGQVRGAISLRKTVGSN